jgi:inorganic pyrophosphatase
MRLVALVLALTLGVACQHGNHLPRELPANATAQLVRSLEAARAHTTHIWRDTAAINDDGTINGYVEIPRGERTKWEFDMATNDRAVDRILPAEIGGYPVNYGFVPQTISYDGDPFDVLVLGPPLPGGALVRGVIVGVMFMEDEKGLDSKVVISDAVEHGPRYALTADDRRRIGEFFDRYKQHEPGAFSRVLGWGSVNEGRAHVARTHAFYGECVDVTGACRTR